jgi:pilus assembly protein CpaB
VPITATTSHSGQIRPGDRVDIFVTYTSKDEPDDRTAVMTTKMILDYVEVFAMGADRYSDSAADDQILAKNASLLVTPKQAAILMMAQRKGEISLTLRPKDDPTPADLDALTEIDFNKLGTDYSAREELIKEYEEKLANKEKELTEQHEQELAQLDQRTAEQLQQTLADIKQKYVDEQKRRDQLHAETLAGLEAKNVELQTLLGQAIAESSDKNALAKRLKELQSQNGKLQNLLADARKRAENSTPIEVEEVEIVPEKWQIKVISGKQESLSEFDIVSEKSEDESKDENSNDSKPIEEETSTKYSPKNENSAE